jgi:CheY-like chemotaxis protein
MLAPILAGLVANARQSLPGGGQVTLQTEHIEVDETHARIQPGARCGEFVRLTISDNGRGFSTEQLRRLWTELPAPPRIKSTPVLSLPLIAGIVKRRHGWIETHSRSGGGTTIHVYFPAGAPLNAADLESPWVSETVLLVDDDDAMRRMVKTALERASYDVVEAGTGGQALGVWERHRERVKLLLTDMVMPDGLTGRDLAQRLLAAKPSLKVIYTSGFDLEAAAQQDAARGTIRFLSKPYDMRGLLETVHETMTHIEVESKPQAPSTNFRRNCRNQTSKTVSNAV